MFIKELKFINNCQGFENGKGIVFGNKQQDLIDFYIKSMDKIEEGEKEEKYLSERLQINCILGENGAGKTKLLSNIIHFFEDAFRLNHSKKLIFNNDTSLNFPNFGIELDDVNQNLIVFNENEARKKIGYIFDDFFVGSDMFGYSIHNNTVKKLVQGEGLNQFYCEVYNFLQKKTHKEIFSKFLNINSDYKYNLYVNFDISWYKNYGGSHVYFLENSGNNFDNNLLFINKNLDFNNILLLFRFLYGKIEGDISILDDYKNLSKIINQDLAKNIFLSLSDLLIATLNYYRDNLNEYNINSDMNQEVDFFIKQKGFKEFNDILLYTKLFLKLIKNEQLLSKHPVNQVEFLDANYSNETWISLNDIRSYIDEGIKNIDNLFLRFKNLGIGVKDRGNHNIFRRISGYEKQHVGASDYFFLEIINGFKDNKDNDKISRSFKNVIYYNIRNLFHEKILNKSVLIKNLTGFSDEEKKVLDFLLIKLNLVFKYNGGEKQFNHLSSGEKIMLIRFVNIYKEIYKQYIEGKGKKNFIILADEPDLHLHLEWQQQYIQRLIDVFSTIKEKDITMHFIIATHSPFIISDIPKENIIKLGKNAKGEVIQLNQDFKKQKETFGANYIDIIRNGFFKNGVLMGTLSANIISNLALIEKFKLLKGHINTESLNEHEQEIYNNYVEHYTYEDEYLNNLKKQIGDDFIKNNLLYINFKNDKNRYGGDNWEAQENEGVDGL